MTDGIPKSTSRLEAGLVSTVLPAPMSEIALLAAGRSEPDALRPEVIDRIKRMFHIDRCIPAPAPDDRKTLRLTKA